MARTIPEIKTQMTDEFIADPVIISQYQLEAGKTFDEQFSPVSIESILFYIVATGYWIQEMLFDTHTVEINAALDAMLPHTVRWYRTKVLQFQYPNRALIPDTDQYDNTGLTPEEIEELQVVKYCAVEDRYSKLYIKVAKGEPGARQTLSDDEETALSYYINEIKDAGVPYQIINQQADKFAVKAVIYYNPMLLNPADRIVETAIREYVSNLTFNGEYANVFLVDHLQAIPGVIIPHLIEVRTQRAANPWEIIDVKTIAESGYFIVENDSDLDITYIPYGQ